MAIWKLNYSPTSFINVETPEEDLSELEASHILESVLGGEEPLKTSYKDTQGYWLESDEDNIYRFFDNDDLKKATVTAQKRPPLPTSKKLPEEEVEEVEEDKPKPIPIKKDPFLVNKSIFNKERLFQ